MILPLTKMKKKKTKKKKKKKKMPRMKCLSQYLSRKLLLLHHLMPLRKWDLVSVSNL
jgi:hypothetical protein